MILFCLQVDPNGVGTVGAMEAARFLKKSGLSDVVLSRVWDLSDPGSRGCLDKAGMFVALKLVAVAQSGQDINLANVTCDLPPPKMVCFYYAFVLHLFINFFRATFLSQNLLNLHLLLILLLLLLCHLQLRIGLLSQQKEKNMISCLILCNL